MIWQLSFILLIVTVVCAITALTVRDLLAAVFVLMAYSFSMALLFAEMGAVDVAFTEAAIGAGISGAFFIAALFSLNRRSED
ncbi:Na(+)/H(+) antiporter subunit B [Chloroflexota bacterium]